MTINEQTLVADIATKIPSSVRVFQRLGIDFCCGGQRPLAVVCEERRLSFPALAVELAASASARGTDDRDWTVEPLHVLVDHLVSTYHARLREDLPQLERLATRVQRVHGLRAPRLLGRIEAIVGELSADLRDHMAKEEAILFPTIRALEAGNGLRRVVPIDAPIRVMTQEHDRAGELLSELRALTEGFARPDWACTTVRALYQGLEELERDMHVHVHLENNVLFPAALRLAEPAGTVAH
jgi:regulator of cell morphogenesis and NO signaling